MDEMRGLTGDILLEAGTNEFEVLVFRLGDQSFGVNVAKVREVLQPLPIVQIPHKHPSVIGFIHMRGTTLTLIDLRAHLSAEKIATSDGSEGTIIITEFNAVRIGFLVTDVERIHRLSWSKLLPIPSLNFADSDGRKIGCTTGALDIDGRLILMVDFESVADSILMQYKLKIKSVDNPLGVDRGSKRVIIAEDSPFMRNQLGRIMLASGYSKVELYSDGQAAWEAISSGEGSPIDAVVSDIEMPRMDGLYLTKLIKASPKYQHIPVVLFSSLISEDNANKGLQVGATVQIPKPDLPEMVQLVDRIISGEVVDQTTVGEIALQSA